MKVVWLVCVVVACLSVQSVTARGLRDLRPVLIPNFESFERFMDFNAREKLVGFFIKNTPEEDNPLQTQFEKTIYKMRPRGGFVVGKAEITPEEASKISHLSAGESTVILFVDGEVMFQWNDKTETIQLRRQIERYWLASDKNRKMDEAGKETKWDNVIEISSVDEWKTTLNRHAPVVLAFVPPPVKIEEAKEGEEEVTSEKELITGKKTRTLLRAMASTRPLSAVYAWTVDPDLVNLVQFEDSSVKPEDPTNPFVPSVTIKKKAYFQDDTEDLDGVLVLYRSEGDPVEWKVKKRSETAVATDDVVDVTEKAEEEEDENIPETLGKLWKWFELNSWTWAYETNKDNFNEFVQTGRPLMMLWLDLSKEWNRDSWISKLEEACWSLRSSPILCLYTDGASSSTKYQMLAFGIDRSSNPDRKLPVLSIHDLSAEHGQWNYVFNKTEEKITVEKMIEWASKYLEGKLVPTIRNAKTPSLSDLLKEAPPGSGKIWDLNYNTLTELVYGADTLARVLPGSLTPPSRSSPFKIERKSPEDFDLVVAFHSRAEQADKSKASGFPASWESLVKGASELLEKCSTIEPIKNKKPVVFATYNIQANSQPQNFHHLRDLPSLFFFHGTQEPVSVTFSSVSQPSQLASWLLRLPSDSLVSPEDLASCEALFV